MGIIRVFIELAAAAANLHPDHRARYDHLVEGEGRSSADPTMTDAAGSVGPDNA